MNHIATTATAPSTPTDQRVRLVIEAEIFQDSEGGPDSLIVTTDSLACEPTSPARLLGMVEEARAQLDQIERLAQVHEAEGTFRAIVAEHNLTVEEWDTSTLNSKLRKGFRAFGALLATGERLIVIPRDQDPIERVDAVVHILRSLGVDE